MMDGGSGWIGWAIGLVVMVGFLALLVWAVTTGTQRHHEPAPHGSAPEPRTADEILAERFARGEIDAAEFDRRREVLRAQ